ncbi:tryptophan dimethylallyltransferase family protein [Bradyrhizobium forestalis]|nr:tryptophan dimethylallyltransferase family protein [Bradyrhizobium forestalis]
MNVERRACHACEREPMGDLIEAVHIAREQLRRICTATGLIDQQDGIITLFTGLCTSAGLLRLPIPPRWSGMTDDCTPMELSTSFDAKGTRIRFLIEAQADPPCPQTYWAAGERLCEQFAGIRGVDLAPLEALADLFRPTDTAALFAMWHAVDWRGSAAPLCKVYFNPAARGRSASSDLIAAALERLGFGHVSGSLLEVLGDMTTHLAVDLVPASMARVKIYVRHFQAAPAEFDRRAERIGITSGLGFADACRIICRSADALQERPAMTCYHLNAGDRSGPSAMTLYLPLYPYAASDKVAAERIAALLTEAGLQADEYRRVADALLAGREADSDGLHTYVGFRRSIGGVQGDQITSYFSPTLFQPRFGRLALDPDRFWPSAVPPV